MRLFAALVFVFLTGFIALSLEIVWVRLYSFASGGASRAFGVLLGAYLLGLALGSLLSLRFRNDRDPHDPGHLGTVGGFVLASNLAGFALVPAVSWLVPIAPWYVTLPLVAGAATLLGATLPLLCHFAIPPDGRAGQRLSWLYLANILGSFAGSLLTGFVLMAILPLRTISVLLAIGGIAVATGIYAMSDRRPRVLLPRVGAAAGFALAVVLLAGPLFDGLWQRLQRDLHGTRLVTVIEGRQGVITVDDEGVIYGGGIYDGRLSTELPPGSWLVRPYFLAAVHPRPRRMLEIGVSGGAWTQILAHHPDVGSVTAVEINPAYRQVIGARPEVKSLLENPKVEIVIDDGRRWLVRHPDARFDAIVINMTYHWRAHAGHLLSREFMELVKAHLEPGGVFLLNATGSKDVAKTGLAVFGHGLMVLNNILVSEEPIRVDRARWRRVLSAYEIDGKPVFDLATEKGRSDLEEVLSLVDTLGKDLDTDYRLMDEAQMRAATKDAEVVTDDNMRTEY